MQRRPKNELVLCDDSLTWGAVGDAIEASEPSRLIRQHTKLTIEAPIEEEKEEEKHDENTKPIKQKIKEKEELALVVGIRHVNWLCREWRKSLGGRMKFGIGALREIRPLAPTPRSHHVSKQFNLVTDSLILQFNSLNTTLSLPSLDAKPLNSTLSLPLCHHSLLSPAPSLQFNSLSPVKSKLLLLILTEFLLSMVRPATEWFRDWKRCMDSAYVLRFRPVRVRKIEILKHSPDCMLVQQDSSNWPRDNTIMIGSKNCFTCDGGKCSELKEDDKRNNGNTEE
ncbi:hypothetical protein JHK86_048333 [Glycine max]|nr:hypothetical protein JHK86_048333 [Glycine max]